MEHLPTERPMPGTEMETPQERQARIRLMDAAAEAEELIGVDELEQYAETLRHTRHG